MLYDVGMDNPDLLQFPCDFPIKAMGRMNSGFEVKALEIVRRHAPEFDVSRMRSAISRHGNYQSVTFVVPAVSRDQLDAIYRELCACDDLLMVL